MGVGKQTLVQASGSATPPAAAAMPLPPDVRAKMERAFGADFSNVRISEGPEPQAMGARAFTRGTEIHFAPGQYDPHSPQGQELLGHELSHVVQQAGGRAQAAGGGVNRDPGLERQADEQGARAARGEPAAGGDAAPERRQAIVAPAERAIQHKLYADAVTADYGGYEVTGDHILEPGTLLVHRPGGRMYRYVSSVPRSDTIIVRRALGNRLYTYDLSNDAIAEYEDAEAGHQHAIGEDVCEQMTMANRAPVGDDGIAPSRGVHYEHNFQQHFPQAWKEEYRGGYANPAFFVRVQPMCWMLLPGKRASEGLRVWLAGPTIAECGSTLVAIQLNALLQVVGDAKFDRMFGGADPGVRPTAQLLVITSQLNECMPAQLIKGTGMTDPQHPQFKVGAQYYFKNHPHYLRKHPDGALRGENALCVGFEGQQPLFSGFGVSRVTIRGMCEMLLDAYNDERTEDDYHAILQVSIPPKYLDPELAKHKPCSFLYSSWIEEIDRSFHAGVGFADQLAWDDWLAAPGVGLDGEGVMLDARAMLQLVLDEI